MKYVREKSGTFLMLAFSLVLSYCSKENDEKSRTFVVPEKIVLGGETTGKIALVMNGRVHKIAHVQGAVFHQVMFSRDGRYVFAAASNLNKVYVFDGESLNLVKEIEVGRHPSHMDTDDSGELIAVVNEESGDVSFISVSKLVEVGRVSGFSVPHFARYYNGFWFVANFGAPKISVIRTSDLKVETELTDRRLPECPEGNEECAFFDVSIRKDIGQGLASHVQSGAIVDFDPKDMRINKVITRDHPKLSFMREDNIEAYKANLSPFDSIGWIVFRGGVVGYNVVARDVEFVWRHTNKFTSQFGIEYPGKLFVLMQGGDEKGVAILNRHGYLEKIVDVGGIPGEGIYHNGHVFIFVEREATTDILAIDGSGNVRKVAEVEFNDGEGIHIPGAYPHCH